VHSLVNNKLLCGIYNTYLLIVYFVGVSGLIQCAAFINQIKIALRGPLLVEISLSVTLHRRFSGIASPAWLANFGG
jgi:hypothetical protein